MKKFLIILAMGLFVGSTAEAECEFLDFQWFDDVHFQPLNFTALISAPIGTSTWFFAKGSQTSDCTGFEANSNLLEQQIFVAASVGHLSQDIAKGGGPHLQSLFSLLGCLPTDYPGLAAMTQQNFEQLFPSFIREPKAFLTRLKNQISNKPSLNCQWV